MKRVGKYTGHIYDKDYPIDKIEECAVCITDLKAEDELFLIELKARNKVDCSLCMGGCPESVKDKG